MTNADHEFCARISVGPTNRKPLRVADEARRKNDYLGRHGMRAKRGQKDSVFLTRGYLDFWYPTRELREAYVALVEEDCDPAVLIERRRRPAKRPAHQMPRR